jgi:uncharacterized protein involved in exopolysaccharide biosynthesis
MKNKKNKADNSVVKIEIGTTTQSQMLIDIRDYLDMISLHVRSALVCAAVTLGIVIVIAAVLIFRG